MSETPHSRTVICVANERNEVSLQLWKIYKTLPDSDAEGDGMLRCEAALQFMRRPLGTRKIVDSPHAAAMDALTNPPDADTIPHRSHARLGHSERRRVDRVSGHHIRRSSRRNS